MGLTVSLGRFFTRGTNTEPTEPAWMVDSMQRSDARAGSEALKLSCDACHLEHMEGKKQTCVCEQLQDSGADY
jgi:hypothetical protein